MNCTHPLYAYDFGFDADTGKNHIKLAPKRADISTRKDLERRSTAPVIPLPCGKCLACKVNHAREWSIRCMLEASLYSDNWFLTLTYDDAHLPGDNKIHIEDLQKFFKDLRYRIPNFRYFACGEYGSSTHRPHYHIILFNCSIPDLKYVSLGRFGGSYFASKMISDVWSKGNITIGYVNSSSCEYVARYCIKKVYGDEFLTMSLKPGIGAEYFDKHFDDIYATDGVYVKGSKHKVPRYFDKLLERLDPSRFVLVKSLRNENAGITRSASFLGTGANYDEEIYLNSDRANLGKFRNKLKRGGC